MSGDLVSRIMELDFEQRSLLADILYNDKLEAEQNIVTELRQKHKELYKRMAIVPGEIQPEIEFDGTRLNKNIAQILQESQGSCAIYANELDFCKLMEQYKSEREDMEVVFADHMRLQCQIQKVLERIQAISQQTEDEEIDRVSSQIKNIVNSVVCQ